jgi:hypothetical protein
MQITELHQRVPVTLPDGKELFELRISGSGDKAKMGGKMGSEKNNESFINALVGMNRLSISEADPKAKFQLINLMASINPLKTKEWLKTNDAEQIFENLYMQMVNQWMHSIE